MRILFATSHHYLPQRVGGSESSTHDLAVTMAQRGHSVAVLASLRRDLWLYLTNRMRGKWQNTMCPVDYRSGYPVYRGRLAADNIPDALQEVFTSFKPDVLICQAGFPLVFAQASVALDCATVVYLRDVEFHHLGGDPNRIPNLRFVANSNFTAERFASTYAIPAAVIPPLVKRERYLVNSSGSKVLFVNPLPAKGLDIALALAESNPNIPFLFQESWPLHKSDRRALRQRFATLPNITFQNQTQDMRSVYAQARLLLAPSQWEEAWGRVVTEAQINGIPALTSDRGGLRDTVGSGGMVVPSDAPIEAWNNALRTLWNSASDYQKYSQAARQRVEDGDISEQQLAARLEQVLLEAVKTKTAPRANC